MDLNSFRIGGPRPIDEKKLDFQAAFLELGTSGERTGSGRRVGRQELEYGSGRLIDVREGPNVRLSFDGFMVKSKSNAWNIDGFAVRPDLDNPGFFNNAPNHAIGFWGVYATRPLAKRRFRGSVLPGPGSPSRQPSIAVRLMKCATPRRAGSGGPVATESKPGWDFDYEGSWQFGTFGSGNIRAWTVASDTGYRFPTVRAETAVQREGRYLEWR